MLTANERKTKERRKKGSERRRNTQNDRVYDSAPNDFAWDCVWNCVWVWERIEHGCERENFTRTKCKCEMWRVKSVNKCLNNGIEQQINWHHWRWNEKNDDIKWSTNKQFMWAKRISREKKLAQKMKRN